MSNLREAVEDEILPADDEDDDVDIRVTEVEIDQRGVQHERLIYAGPGPGPDAEVTDEEFDRIVNAGLSGRRIRNDRIVPDAEYGDDDSIFRPTTISTLSSEAQEIQELKARVAALEKIIKEINPPYSIKAKPGPRALDV